MDRTLLGTLRYDPAADPHGQANHGALLETCHFGFPPPSSGVVQGTTVLRRRLSLRPIDQERASRRAVLFPSASCLACLKRPISTVVSPTAI